MAIRGIQRGAGNAGHPTRCGALERPDLELLGMLKAATVATCPDWEPHR
jgi:hypothetical protein